jgi:hypothetical protein
MEEIKKPTFYYTSLTENTQLYDSMLECVIEAYFTSNPYIKE